MHQLSILKFLDMCAMCRTKRKEIKKRERKAAKMPAPLTSFPQFRKLPKEICMMIWNMSLEARTIEIQWTETRGFFTRVPTPVALRVCHDSRDTVKFKYSLCFGNVIYKPSTVFNFSLDTLYIDTDLQEQALHFLASLSVEEIANIKYLAVDTMLNFDFGIGDDIEWDLLEAYRKLASSMPALKRYHLVSNVVFGTDDYLHEGNGPMQLYEDWPDALWAQHCCDPDTEFYDEDEEFQCESHVLPQHTSETVGLKIAKMGGIWGWRPLKK